MDDVGICSPDLRWAAAVFGVELSGFEQHRRDGPGDPSGPACRKASGLGLVQFLISRNMSVNAQRGHLRYGSMASHHENLYDLLLTKQERQRMKPVIPTM